MPTVLLRPHILGCKNKLTEQFKHRHYGREFVVGMLSVLMMWAVYAGTRSFFVQIQVHPVYRPELTVRLISICALAFFLLLLFSSSIAAIGYLFTAKDIPLLLSMPVSLGRLFLTRLVQIAAGSAWMFLMFAVPTLLGMYSAFNLPPSFIPVSIAVCLFHVIVPVALATAIVTLFVNIVPPHRIRDLLVIAAFLLVCVILGLNVQQTVSTPLEQRSVNDLLNTLSSVNDPHPAWMPSKWSADIITTYLVPSSGSILLPAVLLFGAAVSSCAFGYLVFEGFFFRGWSRSLQGNRSLRIRQSNLTESIGRIFLPFCPQLRAFLFKEIRTFLRDTTQSLQLLLLLLLTFVYLYNFRALRANPSLYEETLAWWQVILSLANAAFGSCVVAAICTRFVFPSVSLEGRAYFLIRTAPLSINDILRYKFRVWILPICALSVLLLVSGAWAIYGSIETVFATAIVAVALSIGIVGLGVGVGAVFARFDWEAPAQVTASFGSLVYMLLSLGTVLLTLAVSTMLFILTCVPNFSTAMSRDDYILTASCTVFLMFFINYAAAKQAIAAGAQRLKEFER